MQMDEMPLHPQVALEPFDKWGMDFFGPIDPPSGQNKYIIVWTNYLTKWVETKAMKVATEEKVAEFLSDNVFYKFGYPREIVTDQGAQFTSHLVENIFRKHKIQHSTSTSCHPQVNGQAEVTNIYLESILTKVVSSNRKYLEDRLVKATWAYNTTQKTTIGFNAYDLVYGKKALLLVEFEFNTLGKAFELNLDL